MQPGPMHIPSPAAEAPAPPRTLTVENSPAPPLDFEALVDRHQTPLLRYAIQLLGPQAGTDEAEDVVQEAFFRLHRQLAQHGPESVSDPFVWLGRVAHNLAIDTGRKRTRRKKANQTMTAAALYNPPPQPFPDAAVDSGQREACAKAMAELQNLPDAQRQAITLRIFEGLTMQQIAQITDTSASNVCYRLSQGLAALARAMKRQGVIG